MYMCDMFVKALTDSVEASGSDEESVVEHLLDNTLSVRLLRDAIHLCSGAAAAAAIHAHREGELGAVIIEVQYFDRDLRASAMHGE
jgi:hypothetical protein